MNTRIEPRSARRLSGTLAAGLLLSSLFLFAPVDAAPELAGSGAARGREIYISACAACHGADGAGAPASQLGFDVALPDFTDCSFATREPDADWGSVVRRGGPTRAFSELMPAFGDALTDEQVQLALDHVRGFCVEDGWPRGELNLPRPLVTEKAYPEDEAVVTFGVATEGRDVVSGEIVFEKRFGARNQFEIVVPFGWRELDPAESDTQKWRSSVGDVALGVKRAVYHDLERGSVFSVAGEVILPTGNEDEGFGKPTAVLEPFVAFGQILPREFFLHAQSGLELPVERDEGIDEAFLRTALGRRFTSGGSGRVWTPMLELLGGTELTSSAKIEWDVVPQMQVTLSKRQHVMLNAGFRVPLTDSDPRATEFQVYLLWDWFDGGLLEGW
jgi:mono/diheme cytochrome c family protein